MNLMRAYKRPNMRANCTKLSFYKLKSKICKRKKKLKFLNHRFSK